MCENDEFCIENEELCIQNEELRIVNDEFCRWTPAAPSRPSKDLWIYGSTGGENSCR